MQLLLKVFRGIWRWAKTIWMRIFYPVPGCRVLELNGQVICANMGISFASLEDILSCKFFRWTKSSIDVDCGVLMAKDKEDAIDECILHMLQNQLQVVWSLIVQTPLDLFGIFRESMETRVKYPDNSTWLLCTCAWGPVIYLEYMYTPSIPK